MTNNSKVELLRFNPKNFGMRLRNARNALGITQEELAEMLCVERTHIARMEIGKRVCSVDLLVEMAMVLEVSTDYLLVEPTTNATAKQKLLIAIRQLNEIVQNL